jgi:hypothetical protein
VISAIAISTRDPAAKPPRPQQLTAIAASKPAIATDTTESAHWQTYPASAATRKGTELAWAVPLGLGGSHDFALRYVNTSETRDIEFRVLAADGALVAHRLVRLAHATEPREARIEGIGMNAGDYTVTLTLTAENVQIESLHAN